MRAPADGPPRPTRGGVVRLFFQIGRETPAIPHWLVLNMAARCYFEPGGGASQRGHFPIKLERFLIEHGRPVQ
jgi:hypothetical protein